MSELSAFLMDQAGRVENVRLVASERFCMEGEPVFWEIRCVSSIEDEELRRGATRRVPSPRGKGLYTNETDVSLYLGKLAAAATVFPDLKSSVLQDSYGVMGEDALLKAMLTPGEYADYLAKVQEVCGFDRSFSEMVDDAKN